MNGYLAFYKGRQIEVYAASSYAAQQEAAQLLKVPSSKTYLVSVILAEKQGVPVLHAPQDVTP